ncbi:MAG: 4-hydroxythreonine-4-phosphate dehydrogenase PdxA [Leptospiraceae bacterium]|nr:4-hydroxythreonine-4-phosphate dehydrogenase PdxA [Leptospiraceae bacterium]MCP5499879.1 4-hydroxythreonine-4-phosphate dehydrogenase PdxA [Leptospiraceae bacterium]
MQEFLKPLLITEGDPAGVGREIFKASISTLKLLSEKRQIIYIGYKEPVERDVCQTFSFQSGNGLFFYPLTVNRRNKEINPGEPSELSGNLALESLRAAIQIQKQIGGNMITLPLSKEWVIRSGETTFSGHTEFLRDAYQTQTFMMMTGPRFKVIPLSTHIPFVKVPSVLQKFPTGNLARVLKETSLYRGGNIAFCGLNPHAGENGKIGQEEEEILQPMINTLRAAGLPVEGPLSADGVFIPEKIGKYEIILACYHDQGLIPFKALEGKKGVNITLGLDFIRVSPDHGTAFDIAGKGLASPQSFLECLQYC